LMRQTSEVFPSGMSAFDRRVIRIDRSTFSSRIQLPWRNGQMVEEN
jgi:hypothetical protein